MSSPLSIILDQFWVLIRSPDFSDYLSQRMEELIEEEDEPDRGQYELENQELLDLINDSHGCSELFNSLRRHEHDFYYSYIIDYLWDHVSFRDRKHIHYLFYLSKQIITIRAEKQWQSSERLCMAMQISWEYLIDKVAQDMKQELQLDLIPPIFDSPELSALIKTFKRPLETRPTFVYKSIIDPFRYSTDFGPILSICWKHQVIHLNQLDTRDYLKSITMEEWNYYNIPVIEDLVHQYFRQLQVETQGLQETLYTRLPRDLIEFELKVFL
jgi:hypothetical protein